ncbi:MAG: prepilin-type N-terminal cleavage/methylation domain-containing protein [Pontiellaceae bacterium]
MKISPLIKKKRTCCGLTLVEVLLALVILSIGVSSMMIAMSQALSVVRTARNREIAQNLLRRIDLDFPIEKIDFEERIESGEFDDPEGYYWTREILLIDEEERPGLFLTRTRIEWSERGRDAFEEVQLYTYAPGAESITSEIR